jgi:hypothetical protein
LEKKKENEREQHLMKKEISFRPGMQEAFASPEKKHLKKDERKRLNSEQFSFNDGSFTDEVPQKRKKGN